jgi:hypothetical protein
MLLRVTIGLIAACLLAPTLRADVLEELRHSNNFISSAKIKGRRDMVNLAENPSSQIRDYFRLPAGERPAPSTLFDKLVSGQTVRSETFETLQQGKAFRLLVVSPEERQQFVFDGEQRFVSVENGAGPQLNIYDHPSPTMPRLDLEGLNLRLDKLLGRDSVTATGDARNAKAQIGISQNQITEIEFGPGHSIEYVKSTKGGVVFLERWFDDYRDVGGHRVPFRILCRRISHGGSAHMLEQIVFEKAEFNVPVDAASIEAVDAPQGATRVDYRTSPPTVDRYVRVQSLVPKVEAAPDLPRESGPDTKADDAGTKTPGSPPPSTDKARSLIRDVVPERTPGEKINAAIGSAQGGAVWYIVILPTLVAVAGTTFLWRRYRNVMIRGKQG